MPKKKTLKYTLAVIHHLGNHEKYDYSAVTEKHIVNCRSRIPIRCKTCKFILTPTISNHFNKETKCANCYKKEHHKRERWTFKKFNRLLREGFDYSEVTELHIINNVSFIPISCKKCSYKWSTTLTNHFHIKSNCPNCMHSIPYNLESFKKRAYEVHGNKFNYSNLSETDISGIGCLINIECNQCDFKWFASISNHIHDSTGCPKCAKSGYSKISIEWLSYFEKYIKIQHAINSAEFRIELKEPTIYWKKYLAIDGYCKELNLCLEYDGCLWHGCENENCEFFNVKIHPINKISMDEILEKTKMKHQLIKDMGYNLVVIRGCDYENIKKLNQINKYVLTILSSFNIKF